MKEAERSYRKACHWMDSSMSVVCFGFRQSLKTGLYRLSLRRTTAKKENKWTRDRKRGKESEKKSPEMHDRQGGDGEHFPIFSVGGSDKTRSSIHFLTSFLLHDSFLFKRLLPGLGFEPHISDSRLHGLWGASKGAWVVPLVFVSLCFSASHCVFVPRWFFSEYVFVRIPLSAFLRLPICLSLSLFISLYLSLLPSVSLD